MVADRRSFLPEGGAKAPKSHGVYVTYDPRGVDDHVGRTYGVRDGLRQRLNKHLHSASYVDHRLKNDGSRRRTGYTFRFVMLPSDRQRTSLEAYAAGHLCPAHISLYRARSAAERESVVHTIRLIYELDLELLRWLHAVLDPE